MIHCAYQILIIHFKYSFMWNGPSSTWILDHDKIALVQ